MLHSNQAVTEPPIYHKMRPNKSVPYTEPLKDESSYNGQQLKDDKLDKLGTFGEDLSEIGTLGAPIKTYKVVSKSVWTEKLFEIQHDERPIFWVRNKRSVWHGAQINVHTDSDHGEILAACKISNNCFKRDLRYMLGNPDCTDKDSWPTAACGGWSSRLYSFEINGEGYQWKRTHRKELGSSNLQYKNFKLIDGRGDIVAIFVHTQNLFKGKLKQIGTFAWFRSLSQEVELSSLVILMGIQEAIRESEQASAASSGA